MTDGERVVRIELSMRLRATEFKDVRGTTIWTGDLLRPTDNFDRDSGVVYVCNEGWHDASRVEFRDNHNNNVPSEPISGMEIVGNIFENFDIWNRRKGEVLWCDLEEDFDYVTTPVVERVTLVQQNRNSRAGKEGE